MRSRCGGDGGERRASTASFTKERWGGSNDLRRGRDLELKPYVLGRATATDHDALGNALKNGEARRKGRHRLQARCIADRHLVLTVNTDFAQVEVDEQVINLTRLPTFFPEKRDFFLQLSSVFDFATPSRVQPFKPRRIGLGGQWAGGADACLVVGCTGSSVPGPWACSMCKQASGDRANDLVVRVKHDLLDRSVRRGDRRRSGSQQAAAEPNASRDWTWICHW